MCFSIQDIFVETDRVGRREEKVEVFQCFRKPETLHRILVVWRCLCNIIDSGVAIFDGGSIYYGIEHRPTLVLPDRITGDAVHVPDRLNSFRPLNPLVH
jgi:hypothetical protein